MIPLAGVTAVILAGGLGTRLRPAVSDRPKVLAPVRGRPFLAYLLDQVARAGVKKAVLCTGFMARSVADAFGREYAAPAGAVSIEYSVEREPLGTGGALAAALPRLAGDTFLALNGDSYCDADLPAMAAYHARHAPAATLLLARVADTSRFGRVEVGAGGAAGGDAGGAVAGPVVRFEEKGNAAGAGWINAGVYLLSRRLLESIPAAAAVSVERQVFPGWVGRGAGGLHGYGSPGRFLDIGTPESFAAAEDFLAERRPASE